ncbi:hypothetical protein BH18THE2_BH18THE2_38980 [soil metagenome]
MNQKSIVITAVLAATILTAVFTTTPPFSMKDVEGQIIIPLPGCSAGYERNPLGTCVPVVVPVPGSGDSSETETLTQNQKGVASGEGEVLNCELQGIDQTAPVQTCASTDTNTE